ncbi:uncharacterized protein BCR38DRAFT_486732 [Pseudomassariella vexata]|uniref:Uncharacterized protein n=1 Tax=Pseudomassariella vexata TaxID=1141098 RepID=A0A1Y2DTJ1_9PEZI|nr:uncharacterized protein BCR38DRAFT_486732 [Pseudomassariella vexata]ORY62464.1 hypothetical protein BCR38DRAFT_486732 [Pseudomassariella vexata]
MGGHRGIRDTEVSAARQSSDHFDTETYTSSNHFPGAIQILAGLTLSDTWSPDADEDGVTSGSLYLTDDFWAEPSTVSCNYPYTLVFSQVTATTTWESRPFVNTTGSTTTTIDPPPYTTELVRISKTTVVSKQVSEANNTIEPKPAQGPTCIPINLILFTIQIFPPSLDPFSIHNPQIIIGPVLPGSKPGSATKDGQPMPEEE